MIPGSVWEVVNRKKKQWNIVSPPQKKKFLPAEGQLLMSDFSNLLFASCGVF